MIIVEEECEQYPDRQSYENPFRWEIPEVDEPPSIYARVEGSRVRDAEQVSVFYGTWYVRESGPENGGNLSEYQAGDDVNFNTDSNLLDMHNRPKFSEPTTGTWCRVLSTRVRKQ